ASTVTEPSYSTSAWVTVARCSLDLKTCLRIWALRAVIALRGSMPRCGEGLPFSHGRPCPTTAGLFVSSLSPGGRRRAGGLGREGASRSLSRPGAGQEAEQRHDAARGLLEGDRLTPEDRKSVV